MRLAFLTGALAAGLAVAGLSALVVWLVTLVSASSAAWSAAIWLIPGLAGLATITAYIAEVFVDRGTQSRKRATGEPWAYRE
jgi:hypothetical protein